MYSDIIRTIIRKDVDIAIRNTYTLTKAIYFSIFYFQKNNNTIYHNFHIVGDNFHIPFEEPTGNVNELRNIYFCFIYIDLINFQLSAY